MMNGSIIKIGWIGFFILVLTKRAHINRKSFWQRFITIGILIGMIELVRNGVLLNFLFGFRIDVLLRHYLLEQSHAPSKAMPTFGNLKWSSVVSMLKVKSITHWLLLPVTLYLQLFEKMTGLMQQMTEKIFVWFCMQKRRTFKHQMTYSRLGYR